MSAYRTSEVSATLIVLGVLNLVASVVLHKIGKNRADFEHLLPMLGFTACLVFSGILYAAGLMCTAAAMKTKQDVGRSVAGMFAGGSALIWWFVSLVVNL